MAARTLSVLLLACLAAAVAAQRVQQHPLTNLAESHADVRTAARFVSDDHSERLPLGEPVTILCSFHNGGATPMNVSMIMGSLNSPFQFDVYMKNFTPRLINTTVGVDQEFTFQYSLLVDASLLDTVNDFQLALTVFYDDNTKAYTSTFFNDTRKFFYPDTPTDIRSLVGYAVAVMAALLAYFLLRGNNGASHSSKKTTSSGAASAGDASWTAGGDHMPKPSSKARRRRAN